MKICDLELLAVKRPPGPAGERAGASLLVRLVSDTGREGWGEGPLRWRPEELPERRRGLLAALASRSVFDVEEMLRLHPARDPGAACAVETACWDLAAQAAGAPLYCLFGGGYRQRALLSVRLAAGGEQEVAEAAREMADQGFAFQTLTASGRPEQDAASVRAAQEAVSDRAELRLDAAGRYDRDAALRLDASLHGRPLALLIDPLPAGRLSETAALARQLDSPVALRRSIGGPRDVMAAARSGAASHVMIDLAAVGGLSAARRCAAVADAAGLEASLAIENSVGVLAAAALHLAAALPELGRPHQADRWVAGDQLVTEPLAVADGMAGAPQAPGLGVAVDRGRIEDWQAA